MAAAAHTRAPSQLIKGDSAALCCEGWGLVERIKDCYVGLSGVQMQVWRNLLAH